MTQCLHQKKIRMKTSLLLLLLCHVSSSVKHSLNFYITADSGAPNLPGFMAALFIDDVQVTYCDSSNKTLEPRQDWVKKVFDENPELWKWYTEQCFEILPPLFKSRLDSLIQVFHDDEDPGLHVAQTIEGCVWNETSGNITGFSWLGYDRRDFIKLSSTPWKTKAIIYDLQLLTETYPEHLKLFLKYGNSSLLRTDVPSVSLLQKTPSSPVSCHATGFYPDRAMMFWRKDGEEIHEGVEHGEILPNHDGSFQMNVDLNISSVSPEDWRRYDCVFHLSGVEDDIITKLDETQIRTNWAKKPSNEASTIIIVGVVFVLILAAAGFILYKKKQQFGAADHVCWALLCFVESKMNRLCVFYLFCHFASPVKHSLQIFVSASSGITTFPEFVGVALVDSVQVGYCDSNIGRAEPKQDWVKKLLKDDPQHLEWYTQRFFGKQDFFRANIDDLKRRLNQTGDVHVLQKMNGCEWDDETGDITGYNQYGYNGEDFIALDFQTLSWTAPKPQALTTKLRWDTDKARLESNKIYYINTCPNFLQKYVRYGRSFLQRTDVPSVSLLQKTPSSPVSCHATGFYPDRALMFWRKDGEEIHEGVEHGEILPNHDGSFQMNVDLDISSVSPEDWRRYDCVFHLSGVEDDIITKLDETQIRTNWVKPSNKTSTIIISAVVVVVVVVVVAAAAGFMVHRKKQDQKAPLNSEDSSELSVRLNPETSSQPSRDPVVTENE
ncbi:uncharacterized protein LOC125020304 [Mugil cephalus]|uniref:uncharacterized protein LOC125020304 n=1 Tax=Mugil cephalus TaxID=48193 RepID=UPI001FB6A65F|nr:uncharacterized protein LOC125020304 [Mugil cephalus]